jgi:hypothetical protein
VRQTIAPDPVIIFEKTRREIEAATFKSFRRRKSRDGPMPGLTGNNGSGREPKSIETFREIKSLDLPTDDAEEGAPPTIEDVDIGFHSPLGYACDPNATRGLLWWAKIMLLEIRGLKTHGKHHEGALQPVSSPKP